MQNFSLLNFPGIIALDINGTHIYSALIGFSKNNKIKHEDLYAWPIEAYDKNQYPVFENYLSEKFIPDIVNSLKMSIKKFNISYEGLKLPVGISFAGQISTDGVIYSCSPLFGSKKPNPNTPINIIEEIHKDPQLKDYDIHVLNDISASAWRLSTDSEIGKLSRYLVLYIGNGLGSKIFNIYRDNSKFNFSSHDYIKKEVIIDQKGFAGEMGHIRVNRPPFLTTETLCDCKNKDHLASFILPHGVFKIFEHFKDLHINKFPQQALDFQNISCNNIQESISDFFNDKEKIEIAKKIINIIAELFSRIIANNILSIGFDKVVLTGSVLYQWEAKATEYFIEVLNKKVQQNLNGYSSIDRSFIIEKVFHYPAVQDLNDFIRADRYSCLEGMLVYIADYYETHHQVNVGNFHPSNESYTSFKLSYDNDIEYPIINNDNIFNELDDLLNDITLNRKLLFIVDEHYNYKIKNNNIIKNIESYFKKKNRVVASNSNNGGVTFSKNDVIIKTIESSLVADGNVQEYKSIDNVIRVIEWAHESKLPRDGIVIGVGGGVVLDTIGFAASQFRRMVDYIRIPTTLIGQMDAGIGVKVGVNFKDAKNLIGAFYPPLYVINDVNFLYDLSYDQIACGIAEILKMGVIVSQDIFLTLEKNAELEEKITGEEIRNNVHVKETLIKLRDEAIYTMLIELQKNLVERELKRLVDFGHLFSPVIESISNYRIPHSFAVAIDMYISFHIALNTNKKNSVETLIHKDLFDRFLKIMNWFNLLFYPRIDHENLFEQYSERIFEDSINKTIGHRGGDLNMVVPVEHIGNAGFMNLVSCISDEDYCAIILKDELKRKYNNAIESLISYGKPRSF